MTMQRYNHQRFILWQSPIFLQTTCDKPYFYTTKRRINDVFCRKRAHYANKNLRIAHFTKIKNYALSIKHYELFIIFAPEKWDGLIVQWIE